MIVAIHQPNYLPWCGYFAKIRAADIFVFLDDAQFSKPSYVVRTKIRSGQNDRWLSIPVGGSSLQRIDGLTASDPRWRDKHLKSFQTEYGKAPHFDEVMAVLAPVYAEPGATLAETNQRLVRAVCGFLGIGAEFHLSSAMGLSSTGGTRLVDIVQRVGGTEYLSGAGGEKYQEQSEFEAANLRLTVRPYAPRPYEARGYPFRPGLSIVDALFLKGRAAVDLLDYT